MSNCPALRLAAAIAILAFSAPASAQPKLLEPNNVGKEVNTKADETDPFLLADGVRLMYASNAKGNFDLMVAQRKTVPQPFENPAPIAAFNTKEADERSPFFYAPIKDFYFASNRIADDQFKDLKNLDIFVRADTAAPFAIQGANTPVDEMFPWITANGNEMFFSRKTKEGWRVCVTTGPKLGPPDKGKIIDEIPVGYHHSTLSPDGLTMYLEGPLGKDSTGLFKTTRKKIGGEWEKPKALANLNHADGKLGDCAPAVSLSGMTLFFASDRPAGEGGLDIWWVAVADLKTE